MPALPPPPFPKELGPDGEVRERVRFLLHFVVVPLDFGLEPRPRLVREVDVEWPRDRGRVFECMVSTLAGVLRSKLELKEVESGTFIPHLPRRQTTVERSYDWVTLRCDGSRELEAGGRWSRSGGDALTIKWTDGAERAGKRPEREEYGWGSRLGRSVGSPVPRRTPDRIVFGATGWRVSLEDPLVSAPAAALPAQLPEGEVWAKSCTGLGSEAICPPGALSYLGHVRWSLVPLFASVLLLSQLFRRRELAFLGLLVAAVLLGAAADRYTVGVHLARLGDAAAPAEDRALALDSLETTFFHEPSALAAARRVAADAAEPALLRQKAESAVKRLEAR
jgi:hypothetical protein